jgi:hypothetical protein
MNMRRNSSAFETVESNNVKREVPMRRRKSLLAIWLSALLIVSQVKAITYGFVDTNNTFRNVGAFIVKVDGHNFPICSGTLIASNVFLTASHCTAAVEFFGLTAYVSFDPVITDSSTLIPVASIVTNPEFSRRQDDPGDIGALILAVNAETVYPGITPAVLPALNLLDQLAAGNGLHNATFTPVGYGVQERVVGGGPPTFTDEQPVRRRFALSSFLALNQAYMRLSQNPATGDSGTCFGDSGGPNFLSQNGTQVLAAITIRGDAVCRATNVVYRTDTESARRFFGYLISTYGVTIALP